MPVSYDHEIIVDSRDVDSFGQCRPSALLGHLQEAATQAAESFGFGRRELMRNYSAVWMLSRIWFHLDEPLRWEEELTIRTWHRGGKGAIMYRDYDIYSGGKKLGESVSAWVLVRPEDQRILKLSTVSELRDTGGGPLCKEQTLSKLRMPEGLELIDSRLLRYSDTDINGHVNNTRYADFICDALHLEKREKEQFVQEMQIGYLAQCWPGETLNLLAEDSEGRCFVRGEDPKGQTRFDASITMGHT